MKTRVFVGCGGFGMATFLFFIFFDFLSFDDICGATGTLDPPVGIGLSHAVCRLTLSRLGFLRVF